VTLDSWRLRPSQAAATATCRNVSVLFNVNNNDLSRSRDSVFRADMEFQKMGIRCVCVCPISDSSLSRLCHFFVKVTILLFSPKINTINLKQ